MKKALLILLVVVVVVTGVPLVMSGPMMCEECETGTMAAACSLGVLVAAAFLLAPLVSQLRRRRVLIALPLYAFTLERPPRLV